MSQIIKYVKCRKCECSYAKVSDGGLCLSCKRMAERRGMAQQVARNPNEQRVSQLPWIVDAERSTLVCKDGYIVLIRGSKEDWRWNIFKNGHIIKCANKACVGRCSSMVRALRELKKIFGYRSNTPFERLL